MAKFLSALGTGIKKAGPAIGTAGGAALGFAVGGVPGAIIGAKIGGSAGKAGSSILKSKEPKGGGFTVPPANRSFGDASGDNAKHAKSKYNFPGV